MSTGCPPGAGRLACAACSDPAVAKALAIIHSRYAEELDVETLAREAGVSRTVLGERFVELIGEPPMRYCARWRMRVAANMLRDGKQNTRQHRLCRRLQLARRRSTARSSANMASRRRPGGGGSRSSARRAAGAERRPAAEQVVRYCTAQDGTRLAFSVVGEGPPLVKTANWLNHIEHDWNSPLWRHWLDELTARPYA